MTTSSTGNHKSQAEPGEPLITQDLPMPVRAAMARTWLTALALEQGLQEQPKDDLPEQLWRGADLVSSDLADIGFDALCSVDVDLAHHLIHEAASAALICPSCLHRLVMGNPEEG